MVLDDIHGKAPPNLRIWTERFVELEVRVTERLRRERALSTAENVLRLLGRLLEQLEGALQDRWDDYKVRRAEIEREVIRDLPSFAAEQHSICNKMFEAAASSIRARENVSRLAKRHRQNTTGRIRTAIFGADSDETLADFVQNKAKTLLEKDQRLLRQNIEREIRKLQREAYDIAHHFDATFAAEYRRLEVLGGRFEKNPTYTSVSSQMGISDLISSMQSLQKTFESKGSSYFRRGAAAGAVIGGISGAVIGGIAGALLAPSLDKRKQRYWDSLTPELENYFDKVEKQAQEALSAYKRKTKSALTRHIDFHVTKYRGEVAALIREQQSEKQRLQRLQRSTRADLAEIRRRRDALNAQRDRLAAMTRPEKSERRGLE